ASFLPQPRSRLWRTLLKRPRDLRPFAERIPFDPARVPLPSPEEAARWGEVILLENHVAVLHRDGTASFRVHLVTALYGDQHLAQGDEPTILSDRRVGRPTVCRARLHLPNGTSQPALVADKAVDRGGHVRLLRVAFAPLRPGVVLEYETQEDYFQ